MPCACLHWTSPPAHILRRGDESPGPGCRHPAIVGPGGDASGACCGAAGDAILGWLAERRGRCPGLLQVPGAVRFLSLEPLLEAVDLDKLWCQRCDSDEHVVFAPPAQPWCVECDSEVGGAGWLDACASPTQPGISWIIAGCESMGGRPGRPMNLDWARSLRDQCQKAGVAFFLKQAVVNGRVRELPGLDGVAWAQFPEVTP